MIFWQLFYEFFLIGLFTFGGGYAMIPLIKDAVLKHNWLSETAFYDFIGVCESTPGPVAVNMATYIGSTQAGLLGSIVATVAVVLPSFIIIVLITAILKNFIKNKYVQRALEGIKAIVLGLIIATGLVLLITCLGYESLTSFHFDYISLIILGILVIIYFGFFLITKKKISTIKLILISIVIGIAVCQIASLLSVA